MPALPAPAFPLLHSSIRSTHLISLENLPSSQCLPCQLPLFLYFTHQLRVLTSSPLRTSPPPDACLASSRFSSTSLINREYSPHLPWEPPLLPIRALPAPAFPLLHSSIGSTHLISLENLPSSRCLPCQLPLFLYFTHQSGVLTSSPLRTSPPPDACLASSRFSSTSLINREYSSLVSRNASAAFSFLCEIIAAWKIKAL